MTQTIQKTNSITAFRKPSKYKVVLHNDNATPMSFVTSLLVELFRFNNERAEKVMMEIHLEGKGVAGVYSFEVAEQKQSEATIISRGAGYPLVISLEEDN